MSREGRAVDCAIHHWQLRLSLSWRIRWARAASLSGTSSPCVNHGGSIRRLADSPYLSVSCPQNPLDLSPLSLNWREHITGSRALAPADSHHVTAESPTNWIWSPRYKRRVPANFWCSVVATLEVYKSVAQTYVICYNRSVIAHLL